MTDFTAEVTIEKLVYEGDGLGRFSWGEVVFVPWSAPGDKLSVAVASNVKKPLRGAIDNIVEPSQERVSPPCSVFGTCGGCQWQHLSPTAQQAWKRNIVAETLTRLGKFQNPPVLETLTAPEGAWHYRNKVQWIVNETETGVRLGYHQANSHEVIEFEHCWIAPEPFTPLAHWLRDHLPVKSGIERIEARTNQEEQILLKLEGRQVDPKRLTEWVLKLTVAFPAVTGIVLDTGRTIKSLLGREFLTETVAGTRFQVSAGSFFQTNPQVTEIMLSVLDQWLPAKSSEILDLYCGVGTFGIHFHDRAQLLLGIESSESAIGDARLNAANHQALNVDFKEGDVRALLRPIKESFEVVILDPPRGGCHPEVLEWLASHAAERIIYISCNPATLARDLRALADQGWNLSAVQPLDMFPQTYHIEAMALLERSAQ